MKLSSSYYARRLGTTPNSVTARVRAARVGRKLDVALADSLILAQGYDNPRLHVSPEVRVAICQLIECVDFFYIKNIGWEELITWTEWVEKRDQLATLIGKPKLQDDPLYELPEFWSELNAGDQPASVDEEILPVTGDPADGAAEDQPVVLSMIETVEEETV